MIIEFILLIVGLALIVKGADFLISGSAKLSRNLGIEPIFIGMTVVAFGTSLPEFVVSLFDSLTESGGDIGLGNIIGSNIANIALILGLTAMIKPISIGKDTLKKDIPVVLIISIIAYLMLLDGQVDFLDGIILVVIFFAHLSYIFIKAKKGEEKLEVFEESRHPFKDFLITVLGIVFLYFGAQLLIDNAKIIARSYGISELVIGLTIVAIGTSLPELAATLQAVKKDEHDIGVGGIIGSNVFNILFVMGVVSLIKPYNVDSSNIYIYGPLMLVVTILLYIMGKVGMRVSRAGGFLLFSIYVGYTIFSFFN